VWEAHRGRECPVSNALEHAMEEVNYVGVQSIGYDPYFNTFNQGPRQSKIIMCICHHICRIRGQGRKREGHHWKML